MSELKLVQELYVNHEAGQGFRHNEPIKLKNDLFFDKAIRKTGKNLLRVVINL